MTFFYYFSSSENSMKKPTRTMLDTNTYEILYKKEFSKILHKIESGELIVYGCGVIRNELREIPKSVTVDGKNYRGLLLSIYDQLTKDHTYPVESLAETLAEEYWKSYSGGVAKRKIFPDFLIVAVATLHRLDIVVSEDDKTMKSKLAMQAYEKVNAKNCLETPKFISIEELV
ncbi:MAG: hypothetical protein PHD95_02705 [Candidatus ainarchaeum sp.]|nr:hypothetical protein [Candidatus ainarchaeum sp.]